MLFCQVSDPAEAIACAYSYKHRSYRCSYVWGGIFFYLFALASVLMVCFKLQFLLFEKTLVRLFNKVGERSVEVCFIGHACTVFVQLKKKTQTLLKFYRCDLW